MRVEFLRGPLDGEQRELEDAYENQLYEVPQMLPLTYEPMSETLDVTAPVPLLVHRYRLQNRIGDVAFFEYVGNVFRP